MQQSFRTRRYLMILFFSLGAFLILSSCTQSLSTIPITPIPSLNLTPANKAEATLFPVIGTHTAVVEEMKKTLVPMNETLVPMIASATAVAVGPLDLAPQTASNNITFTGLITWSLIWALPALLISISGYLAGGFQLRPFILFLSYPRHSITILLGEEIDVDQLEPSGFKRLLILLNHWAAIPDSQMVLVILFIAIVLPTVTILTLPSISIIEYFPVSLLIAMIISLTLVSVAIIISLKLLGKALGISWYASIRNHSGQVYNEDFLIAFWVKVLTAWSVGLPAILLVLTWPGPLLLPRTVIGLIAIIYSVVLWRQAVRGIGLPRLSIVSHFLFVPVQMISRQIKLFFRQTYLFNSTTIWPNLQGGKTKLFASALAVFLWLSLSRDEFWRSIMPPLINTNDWLVLILERVQTYYVPIGLEDVLRSAQLSFDLGPFSFIPTWLPMLLKRPGMFSALAVLAVGWLFEFAVWALSSTIVGLNTGLKKFQTSNQPLQAAWIFVSNLAGVLIWRALIWSIISLSPAKSLLPAADILFVTVLIFWVCGWLVVGVRYILLKLQTQRYYLLPLASIGGTVFGPLWGNLKVIFIFIWFIGNLPGLWLTAGRYLPEKLVTFLTHVLYAQAIQFGKVLSVEYLFWLLLVLAFFYALVVLYGTFGVFLRVRVDDDSQGVLLFINCAKIQSEQLGLTLIAWGYFSAILNLALGLWWNLQTIDWLVWLLPLTSFMFFLFVYVILLELNPKTKSFGGLALFTSIWLWPLFYWLPSQWKMRRQSLNGGINLGDIFTLLKYLYLPIPFHPHNWSYTIPYTPIAQSLFSNFSFELPYKVTIRWSRFVGAGFAGGQAIVYFLTDTLLSALFWPWLPGITYWLTGTSLVKDRLLVDPNTISFLFPKVLFSQALLFIACILWGIIFTWFIQIFRSGLPLPYERTKIAVYRNINNLLLATSVVHLIFMPIHMGISFWLQSTSIASAVQSKFLSTGISGLMGLTTLFVFIYFARTTLQWQLGSVIQELRDGLISNSMIQFSPVRLLRLFWNFIFRLIRPSQKDAKFSVSSIVWISLFLELISFGLGYIGWKFHLITFQPSGDFSFIDLTQAWLVRLTGLTIGALLIATMSLPVVYNQSYLLFSALYRILAWPQSFLETSAGQLPIIPRSLLNMFHSIFMPRRLIYPGYRHVLLHTLLAVWFSNAFIGLLSRPAEAIWGQISNDNILGQWGAIELTCTLILASYIAANLTRSIPIAIVVSGLLATMLIIKYASFLWWIVVIAIVIGAFAIWVSVSDSGLNDFILILQRNWSQILSRFESIEKKWFVLETFAELDFHNIEKFNLDNEYFEHKLMGCLNICSYPGLYVKIKSGIYEEDPLVQALRIYFYYNQKMADKFVNSLLFTPQLVIFLEGILPEVRRWLYEAAIRVRFIEMEKTPENYLATLMQLRAARLIDEVGTTFDEPPVWQPLPLPVDLFGISVTDGDRHVGEWVLPSIILRAIWVYTNQKIDVDAITNAWGNLRPSLIAEEVLKAFETLQIMLDSRSLTDIAALTFSEQQVFSSNYSYMIDLVSPISFLAEVAETIARAEEMATQDRPQFYVSALQQLQRLQSLIDSGVREPERQLFGQCVFLWNILLTEALSSTIIPRSQIEIEIEQLEREWEQEEIIVLVITNHAQGAAYNLHIRINPGEGYQVLEPLDELIIEMLPGQKEARVEFRLRIDVKENIWVNIIITYDDAGQPNHMIEDKKLVQYIVGTNEDSYVLSQLNFDKIRNPYHYGLPIIDPGLFFGRIDIMNKIQQMIVSTTQTNIIMLYGQRRMGKSTILRQLLQQSRNGKEFWPIFIDIEMFTLPGTSGFLWELAHEIWRGLPDGHGLPEPIPSEFQISPGTYLIKAWMPLVDTVVSAHGRTLLLLLDEFDLIYQNPRFREGELSEILSIIRGLAHERQKGGIIYVGTYRLLEMTALYQTPLFNQAVPIRVSFLDDNATQLLIRQPARGLLKYDPNAVSKIMRLTGNHPYYLQLICSSIFERAMNFQKRTVNVSRVIDALEQAQQQGGLILDYLWKENTPIQKYVIGALARLNEHDTSRSSASRVQRELSAFMIDITADEVQKSIEALSQWEVILNENGQYRFTVDLFRLWLREHKTLASIRAEVGSLGQKSK